MTQVIAKTAAQALQWVDTTPHHYAAVDEDPGFFVLKGHQHKLRIPNAVHREIQGCLKPGEGFGNRMYVLTVKGRRRLNAAKRAGLV